MIEEDDKEGINQLLIKILSPYLGKVDSLIMGCTHYSLIKKEILEVLPAIQLFDGSNGVAREVFHQLEKNHLLKSSLEPGKVEIYNNKSNYIIDRSYEILNHMDNEDIQ